MSFCTACGSYLLNTRDSKVQISCRKTFISLTIRHRQGSFIIASIGTQYFPVFFTVKRDSNEILAQSSGEAHFSSLQSFHSRLFDYTGCIQHHSTYFILCLETDKEKKKRLEEAFLYKPP